MEQNSLTLDGKAKAHDGAEESFKIKNSDETAIPKSDFVGTIQHGDVMRRADQLHVPINTDLKPAPIVISDDRFKLFKGCFRYAYDNAQKKNGMANLREVAKAMQQQAGSAVFTNEELRAGFRKLEQQNACMRVHDCVVII